GSIGVFWMVPSLGRTLSRKLGVDVETVNTNSSSDWMGGLRTMTEFEYDLVQQSVDRFYDTFVRRVADGRRLGVRYVDEIAQGRVWTGEQALGKGLVDTLGGLDVAIRIAADQAKLSKYSVIERPVMDSFFSRMMTAMSGARAVRNSRNALPAAFAPYCELERTLRGRSGVQAMLPYQITIR
ncbi:MAG: S49 family peptidase, partial [Bacteroidales bacterium]|nr:S49 family peptidase [Bacteroidales bacterium]